MQRQAQSWRLGVHQEKSLQGRDRTRLGEPPAERTLSWFWCGLGMPLYLGLISWRACRGKQGKLGRFRRYILQPAARHTLQASGLYTRDVVTPRLRGPIIFQPLTADATSTASFRHWDLGFPAPSLQHTVTLLARRGKDLRHPRHPRHQLQTLTTRGCKLSPAS